MNAKKRSMILCVIALICSILWFVIDYNEHGLSIGILGGPVLVIGLVAIPSIIDFRNQRIKNPNSK